MATSGLFSRSARRSGPKRRRAYVIGDVHGCLELLERLLSRIESEMREEPRRKSSIVFLGDLIDRGPDSAGVIERLRTYSPAGASTHFIMGNHEEVMIRVLDGDTDLIASWLRFGGAETMRSYGLDPREISRLPAEDALQRIRGGIPKRHVEFLRSFADSISFGEYLFVHAGIRPGVELSEQAQSDLRWIRGPFLEDSTDHGFVVVHGHTITNSVEVTSNRIGIDTGAFCTGTLTALAIDEGKKWLIQTSDCETERVSLGD
jgi:serine/threonine protein phosphatase 1